MSTNDTLRGLLKESRRYVKWYAAAENDLIDRIDAALAEPVSGGVAVVRLELVDYNGTGLHIRQWDALQTLQPGTYELAIAAPFTPEAHAECGWIACADRMPEEAGSYITFSPHGYWPQQVHVWLVNEQAWEHEWLSKPRKEPRPKTWVTHWQPLRPGPSAKAVKP